MSTDKNDSPFTTTSEITVTRRDELMSLFTDYVILPTKIVSRDLRAKIGAAILFVYLLAGTIGVVLVPEPAAGQARPFIPPLQTLAHPLGTTGLGTDLLSLMVHSTPTMLLMMFAGAVFTCVIAVIVGILAGYEGGTVDSVISTFTDLAIAIPGLPLFIVLAVLFEPQNPIVVGIVLSVNRWAGLARQVRSEVLTLKHESFVEASQIMGLRSRTIILSDLLPGTLSFVFIQFARAARGVLYSSVALYFLGILPTNGQNWGIVMNNAQSFGNPLASPQTSHWLLVPMFVIIGLSLGLIMFAQGTDRLFNPRVRAKLKEQ